MGHFSRTGLAKIFVVFTLFTFTSQGVSEFGVRFGQLSDVMVSLNNKWGLQEGVDRAAFFSVTKPFL